MKQMRIAESKCNSLAPCSGKEANGKIEYTDILGRYCAEDVIGDDCLLHYRKYVKDKTATSGLCILYMQHEENTVFYHANPYFDVETILKSDDDDFKNRVSLPF